MSFAHELGRHYADSSPEELLKAGLEQMVPLGFPADAVPLLDRPRWSKTVQKTADVDTIESTFHMRQAEGSFRLIAVCFVNRTVSALVPPTYVSLDANSNTKLRRYWLSLSAGSNTKAPPH